MESKVLLAGDLDVFEKKKKYKGIFETVKTFHPYCFFFMKGTGGENTQTRARKCCSELSEMKTEGGQTAGRRSNMVLV